MPTKSISLRLLPAAALLLAGFGTLAAPETVTLPTFTDGEWKGQNLVFESRTYDATVDGDGTVYLYPKERGERVGKPLRVGFNCYYRDKKNKRTIRRRFAEIKDPPAPKVHRRATELELEGHFEDDVEFQIEMKFDDDKFSFQGEIEDPRGIEYPSSFHYVVRVEQTHNPPPQMELDEIKELMPGWQLEFHPVKGRRERVPYWKSMRNQGAETIEVVGPWGDTKITLDAPRGRGRKGEIKAGGQFHIYKGSPPYAGFGFLRGGNSERPPGEIEVKFD